MEQQQGQAQTQQPQYAPSQQSPTVGFPQQQKKAGGNFIKWAIALIGAIAIILIGGFLVIKGFSSGGDNTQASPTPEGVLGGYDANSQADDTAEPTPSASPAAMEKSDVKIEILNGTGVAGEASFLKTKLEGLGYSNITAANADTQNETTTTVTFDSDVPSDIVDEITSLLKKTYKDVTTKNASLSGGVLVRVLTGPREGAATAAPTASSSPTSTPTASPSPTPTST